MAWQSKGGGTSCNFLVTCTALLKWVATIFVCTYLLASRKELLFMKLDRRVTVWVTTAFLTIVTRLSPTPVLFRRQPETEAIPICLHMPESYNTYASVSFPGIMPCH